MLDQTIARVRNLVRNIVTRVVVDRPGKYVQIKGLGDNVRPDVESFQGQGVYFRAPAGAVGLAFAPAGDTSAIVALGLHKRAALPGFPSADGEGGLHYLGTWKVYLTADGKLALGAQSPSDFVALASKVDAEISRLTNAISTLKTATSTGLGTIPTVGSATKTAFDTATTAIPGSASATGSTQVKCA